MARVTEDERARFHKIIDDLIDCKLNNEKNSKKVHWNELGLYVLSKMNMIEAHELDLSVFEYKQEDIISECFDSIAVPLFIIDNLRGNK